MEIIFRVFILLVLIFLLVKAADLVENSFVGIAKRLNVNTFTIGFVILALTSSLPETFVAINSAANNASGLSLGNLLGATIILLTLITGVYIIKNGEIKFGGYYGVKEVIYSLLIILMMFITVLDGQFVWLEGFILLLLYTAFIVYVIRKSQREELYKNHRHKNIYHSIAKGILGGVGLIIISNLTVNQALSLATTLHISPIILGLIMLSLGTNLPEFVILLRSNSEEKKELAIGNFIGSATFNAAILGLLIILKPFTISEISNITPALLILLLTIIVYSLVIIKDKSITKKEAFVLIFIFAFFIIIETFSGRA